MAFASKFATERRVFEAHRSEWSRVHAGEYVVIQGDTVAGFFKDYPTALKAGLKRFGVEREFLVKQIWLNDPVYLVS